MDKNTKAHGAICLISIGLLVAAFFKQPYWYYQCVHWIICGAASWGAYFAYKTNRTPIVWVFSALAIAFNPVVPIHFHRSIWAIIDLVAATIFAASLLWEFISKIALRKKFTPSTDEKEASHLQAKQLQIEALKSTSIAGKKSPTQIIPSVEPLSESIKPRRKQPRKSNNLSKVPPRDVDGFLPPPFKKKS